MISIYVTLIKDISGIVDVRLLGLMKESAMQNKGERKLNSRDLRRFIKDVLAGEGVPSNDADTAADVLVTANLSGIDSHGVVRLSHYLRRLRNGTVNKQPHLRYERKAPGLGVVDGDHGLGLVVTARACRWAMKLCEEAGTASVIVRNSSHFGMAGYYVNMLTSHGYAGMVMTHTDRFLIPFGGKKPFLGTNPVAIGFPTGEIPLILDMSTTSIPYGKVVLAKTEGRSIPTDWGFDEKGKPTPDPEKIVGLHPIAGPKGSGLAMIIDIFCGVLSGMPYGPHVNRMYVDMDNPRRLGHFITVWDVGRVMERERFDERLRHMIEELHEIPPATGFDRVYYPGEIEGLNRQKRAKDGIPVDEGLYRGLVELGAQYGVAVPW